MFSRRIAQSAFQTSRPLSSSFLKPVATRPIAAFRIPPSQLRCLSTEVRAAIDKAVGSAPVVLFMKGTPEMPQCGFSRATVQILGIQGVDPAKFVAFNVLEDQELRAGIKEYSEWPTIPQLYVEKDFVGGCDIIMSMHQDGSLAQLLEEKKVLFTGEATEGQTPADETSTKS